MKPDVWQGFKDIIDTEMGTFPDEWHDILNDETFNKVAEYYNQRWGKTHGLIGMRPARGNMTLPPGVTVNPFALGAPPPVQAAPAATPFGLRDLLTAPPPARSIVAQAKPYCKHVPVNVGFSSRKIVCKLCNVELPVDTAC